MEAQATKRATWITDELTGRGGVKWMMNGWVTITDRSKNQSNQSIAAFDVVVQLMDEGCAFCLFPPAFSSASSASIEW